MWTLQQGGDTETVLIGPLRKWDAENKELVPFTDAMPNTSILIWKSGAGAEVSKNAGAGTHIGDGMYTVALDATDKSVAGPLVVRVSAVGALPYRLDCFVEAPPAAEPAPPEPIEVSGGF